MEWLTDKEKRILFSALSREKKVCIRTDKEREPREPYETSLESICESLEKKFYYDRLFKQIEKQIRVNEKEKCIEEIRHIFMTTHPNQLTMAISRWLKENDNDKRNV